jgi:hypothetical protein
VVEWRHDREMKTIAELPPERPQAQTTSLHSALVERPAGQRARSA